MVPRSLKLAVVTSLALFLGVLPAFAPAADAPTGGMRYDLETRVLVLGDSLAAGLRPFLEPMLPGTSVTWSAVPGRTTPQGLRALREVLQETTPDVAIVSLGTNDGSDPVRFRSRVRRIRGTLPPGTCVIWSSLSRPPRKGPFQALNRQLRAEARQWPELFIVRWDLVVAEGRVNLPDDLHPDAAGYELRSRLLADAARRDCGA